MTRRTISTLAALTLALVCGTTRGQWTPGPGGGVGMPGGQNPFGGGFFVNGQEASTQPAAPLNLPKVDLATFQTAALAAKLDVSYRKITPGELFDDLHQRTGVRFLACEPVRRWPTASLEATGITLREALDKLAGDLNLQLDYQAEAIVVTRKADPAKLAALEKMLGEADRWKRCSAVWELGSMGDPAVYPLLAKAAGDADSGVVEWALRALERHTAVLRLFTDEQKDAVAQAIIGRIEQERGKVNAGKDPNMRFGAITTPQRIELLGSLARPKVVEKFLLWLKPEQLWNYRSDAATGLGFAGEGVEVLRATLKETREGLAPKPAATGPAAQPAPQVVRIMGNTPEGDRNWGLRQLQTACTGALVRLRDPQALGEIYARFNRTGAGFGNVNYTTLWELGDAAFRESLGTVLIGRSEKLLPAGGAGATTRPGPMYQDGPSLEALAQTGGTAGEAFWLKVLNDETAFNTLAETQQYMAPNFSLPAGKPAIAAALLRRLEGKEPLAVRLAIWSLGSSHDPKIAEALIGLLDDKDAFTRAAAARALGHTRDPRALEKLVGLAHAKLSWPDVEAEDQAELRKGKAVRMRINPVKSILTGIIDTRDAKALDTLAALGKDAALEKDLRDGAWHGLTAAVWNAGDADRFFAIVRDKQTPAAAVASTLKANNPWGFPMLQMQTHIPGTTPWQLDDVRWADLLLEHLGDADAGRGKFPWVWIVANVRNPWAEEGLFDAAQDPNEEMATQARRALGMFGDPNAEALLSGAKK